MYTIQANPSGTRSIEVSTENLRTIEKYSLFRHLIDSTGIVDEPVLDKLKLNVRSLIASQEEDGKDLLDNAVPGETLEIIMNHADAFQDLKEYLSEQSIGFREIYDGEQLTVQFTIAKK